MPEYFVYDSAEGQMYVFSTIGERDTKAASILEDALRLDEWNVLTDEVLVGVVTSRSAEFKTSNGFDVRMMPASEKVVQMYVFKAPDPSAGEWGFSDNVTVMVSSGNPGGVPGEFEEYMRNVISEWYDGARVILVTDQGEIEENNG